MEQNTPILLIMAAGLGSRYGGLKQIDPIGPNDEILLEFAIQDMISFGGKKIVCVISESIQDDFRTLIVEKYKEKIAIELVIQSIQNISEIGIHINSLDDLGSGTQRTKPWGTGHAIWCARDAISGPFIVINADDFYGREALFEAYDFLMKNQKPKSHCIVTCSLDNMLSAYGTVSRGICSVSENKLITIVEHTKVERKKNGNITHTCQDGTEVILSEKSPTNMNLFGFQKDFISILDREMKKFFEKYYDELTREFFLPSVVMNMIKNKEGEVYVLPSISEWFGMTYAEDRALAREKIKKIVS